MVVGFAAYCVHRDETRLRELRGPDSDFAFENGTKGRIAVSPDGRRLKKMLASAYHDRMYRAEEERGGAYLAVDYVCGIAEEFRRQRLLRLGDEVNVFLIDNTPGPRRLDEWRFGLLRCRFAGLLAKPERTAGGESILVQHTHLRVLAHLAEDGSFTAEDGAQPPAPPAEAAEAAGRRDALHMIFDTESAVPRTLRADATAHPVLQIAWIITGEDFGRLQSHMDYLRYPAGVPTGNDASSSMLKVRLCDLEKGEDAEVVLSRFFAALCRVACSGGMVIAHNPGHDLRQVRRTAQLLGVTPPALALSVVDTVRVASNFANVGRKWPTLAELVEAQGLSRARYEFHCAEDDARALRDVVANWKAEHMRLFAEEVAL